MNCPRCGSVMENKGNINQTIFTSYPPKWNETYVCHSCKVKIDKLCTGSLPPDTSYLKSYTDMSNLGS